MLRGVLLKLILAFLPFSGVGQDFKNLDFEYGVFKAQPRKWSIEGEGENYFARLDSSNSKRGSKSLYVALKNAEIFIFLSIPGRLVAGKNIQVQGYIKSESSDSLQAMLLFHNPAGGKPIPSQPYSKKVDGWELIKHQLTFPEDFTSDRLLIALMASGTGKFWFDDVEITIDGKAYGNDAPDFREPTKKEIEQLNAMAIPIKSIDPDSELSDLNPLSKIIGKARLVALGENSHGSSTIFKVKLRLVKYLVEKDGFSIFALESPAVESDKINEYVLNGTGTLEDVISNLTYPSWQNQEMIDLIQWIKKYNQTAKRKVEFRGFDMQDGTAAFNATQGFAENDSLLTDNLIELKKLFDGATRDQTQWRKVYEKSQEINKYLNSKHHDQGKNHTHYSLIKHYWNIYQQSLSSKDKFDDLKTRDEYMAENIDWIVKNSGSDAKIIISADNTHVTKANGKMGSRLNVIYGDEYLVLGFTYGSGWYSAYGPEKYYQVHPPYIGTYEYFLSKSKFKTYLLDLRKVNGSLILDQPAGFRSIGSRPQETTQFADINLKKNFDVVVFLNHSDHSTPVK